MNYQRSKKISIDWSHLNWANTSVSAILVFVATVAGNIFSPNNSLIAATIATAESTFLQGLHCSNVRMVTDKNKRRVWLPRSH